MFITDLAGIEISAEEQSLLQHPSLSGLLLFSRNFSSPQQWQQLILSVYTMRPDLMLLIDHEGGYVQRLQRHGLRAIPAARVLGDAWDLNHKTGLSLARQYGHHMACDVRSFGLDASLAPVVDLHGNSSIIGKLDRAFHHRSEAVSLLAEAFITGMKEAGMPSTGKHFPGHGRVLSDSHLELPASNASIQNLQEDLKPFKNLIEKDCLDAIMPAHVLYNKVDPEFAAGFSKIWLQNILRTELGFQGLIISDCLSMSGADIGNLEIRTSQALTAGCDLLIICNQSRNTMMDLMHQFASTQNDASLQRIRDFKNKITRFAGNCLKPPYFKMSSSEMSIQKNNAFNRTLTV